MTIRILIIPLFLLFAQTATGQNSVEVFVHTNKPLPEQFKHLKKERSSINTYRINAGIDDFISDLWNSGFIEVEVDSSWLEKNSRHYTLVLGRQFYWLKIKRDTELFELLQNDDIDIEDMSKEPISVLAFKNFHTRILTELADVGYPYVSIRLDSIEIRDSLVNASIVVDLGSRIIIDSIVTRSSDLVHEKVLWRLSGFSKGDWYSQKQIIKAEKNLQFIGIVDENQSVETGFFNDKAWLYLRPKKLKSNRFDGIVGLAPATPSGIPSLSGEVNLQLNNVLKQMESLMLAWRAPGNGSQKLKTQLSLPYFMGSAFGFSGELEMYRKDTSYLNLGASGGVRYSFEPGIWIDLLFERRQSSQLNPDILSNISEFNLNMSKISWQIDKRNKRFNASRGWIVRNQLGYGIKEIPDDISEIQSSDYYEIDLSSDVYLPIYKSWSGFIGLNGGYRSGELADNETYRLGGANLLRGFSEENFTSSLFFLSSVEIRYSFAGGSNFHLFLDGGMLDLSIFPYSPGIGLSLQTKAGLLKLDYALGQILGETFSLQSGLIHIGIQSNF